MRVIVQNDGYFLSHALTAEEQRLNYDSQARHERYLRDRDAGKTGYKGIQGQSSLNAHDPTRQMYLNRYETNRRGSVIARRNSSIDRSNNNSARVSRGLSKYRQRSLDRIAGNSTSNLNSIEDAKNRTIGSIRHQIDMLKNQNSSDKKKNKEDIKRNISLIKDRLENNSERVKAILQRRRNKAEEQTDKTSEKYKSKIKEDAKTSIDQMKSKNNSFHDENDKLRQRIKNSNLNPQKEKELREKIADNAKKILENHERYTSKINSVKTAHTDKMNRELSSISNELNSYLKQNKSQQKNTSESLKSQLKSLRDSNSKEIQRIESAMKSRNIQKQSSIAQNIEKTNKNSSEIRKENRKERDLITKQVFKKKETNEGRRKIDNEIIKKNSKQKLSDIDTIMKNKR